MKENVSLFVPGRLCLFGEHSDWAGMYMAQNAELVEGQAIVTGINLGIYAEVSASDRFEVSSFDENGVPMTFSCEMVYEELIKYAKTPFLFSYCCGVVAYVLDNYSVGGIKITVTKVDIPMKKGLSSSAAVCCLVAKAFNEVYQLGIDTMGIMSIAYHGEILTGSRCGKLDQACAYGSRPVLMHFNQSEIDVDMIDVGTDFHWVIADLGVGKDTKKILTYLHKAYPFATNLLEKREQEALGIENQRVIKNALYALAEGDAMILGQIMRDAQRIFDEKIAPACLEELEAPILHSIFEDEFIKQHSFGSKGVGSQGDGCVQILARDYDYQQAIVKYLNECRGMKAFGFDILRDEAYNSHITNIVDGRKMVNNMQREQRNMMSTVKLG